MRDKRQVAENFNAAAQAYDSIAVLQHTVAHRVLERLDLIKISPATILDIGSGTGRAAKLLARRYKGARIFQTDLAYSMLRHAKLNDRRFFTRQLFVCADAEAMPYQSGVFDMVYSNLMLQWCNDVDVVFREIQRSTKEEGLFIFSSFGPDTLKELKQSFSGVDQDVHVNDFLDMHDLGDALLQAGFENPVMETEYFTLTYDDAISVFRELNKLGAGNTNTGRRRTLMGKGRLQKAIDNYEAYRLDGRIPATFEVVYGHAWIKRNQLKQYSAKGTVSVPVASIRRRGERQ